LSTKLGVIWECIGMAGRTSTGFGIGATITVLALLTLTLFVLTTVFFGRYRDQLAQVQQLRQDQSDVVTAEERNRDDVRNLIAKSKEKRQSLVGFLVETQGGVMQKVTGARRDTLTDLETKLSGVSGADTSTLLALVQSRDAEIKNLRDQLTQSEAARQAALADQQNEVARIASLMASHQSTVDSLNTSVGGLRTEVEDYRKGADDYKARLDANLDAARNAAAEEKQRLEGVVAQLRDESLVLGNQLAVLRGQRSSDILRGGDEASLIDGSIVAVDNTQQNVYLSLGKKQHVVLGMTFSVYADGFAIKPDADGKYPAGKATVEVINVGESTSTARILSEVRGNPIVRGDAIANALFDPNKVYKFRIFGNFDTNRDGIATPAERSDLEALIVAWGGKVVTDLAGDVDFLVLGERPLVPPRPSSDAPFAVVSEFSRLSREASQYDELMRQAGSTSIPVLNENRLYTLIGKKPVSVRQ